MNLFQIANDDQSIYYLGQIFGPVGNILPVGQSPLIMGAMFKTFNTVVLSVGALIVLYVTIVGVVKTAHEGEFLGKGWNSLWTPLRMVIGIAALVPTPSGYSTIQIVMMWVIMQGVGAADTVWNTVLNFSNLMGSPVATVNIPTGSVGNDMANLFQMLSCQETYRMNKPFETPGFEAGRYYCAENQWEPFCKIPLSDMRDLEGTRTTSFRIPYFEPANPSTVLWTTIGTYPVGPAGICGTVRFCKDDTACSDTSSMGHALRCAGCTAQRTALKSNVDALSKVGGFFADIDYQWRVYYKDRENPPEFVQNYCSSHGLSGDDKCCIQNLQLPIFGSTQPQQTCGIPWIFTAGAPTNAARTTINELFYPYAIKAQFGDLNPIAASSENYINGMVTAVNNVVQQFVSKADTSDLTGVLAEASAKGWIFAGAYYYYLSKQNNSNADVVSTIPMQVKPSDPITALNVMALYRNNFMAAGFLVNTINQQSLGSFSVNLPPELDSLSRLSDGMSSSAKNMMSMFMGMLTGGQPGQLATNPLVKLQSLGKNLLIVAQVLFTLIMIIVPILTLIGYLSIYVLGTGFDNPIGGTVTTLAVIFAPLFAILMGALFSFGALLAVYTPLIPYVVFTMGAVTWFILVIEAMIAGPLVALGILSPSSQGHEILGKAEHAVMYLFGIFLRPTMMVFGLMAAMLLAIVVVTMINAAFVGVMAQIYKNPGLIEILLFVGAYVGLVLTALNKCFAMIHIIPDQVIRWIGHAGAGEAGQLAGEGLQGAKGGVEGVRGEASGAGKEAYGRAQQGRGEATEHGLKQRESGTKGQQRPYGTRNQGQATLNKKGKE